MLLEGGTTAPPLGWPTWRDVRQCKHCLKYYTADGRENLRNYSNHVADCGAKAAPKRRRDGPGDGSGKGTAAKRQRTPD